MNPFRKATAIASFFSIIAPFLPWSSTNANGFEPDFGGFAGYVCLAVGTVGLALAFLRESILLSLKRPPILLVLSEI